jgi:hypothetical protein
LIEELIMNTRKASLGAVAVLIVLTATLTLNDGGRAAAQSMKALLVTVTNSVAEPVPVLTVLPPADRVLLEWRGGSGDPCSASELPLARIFPDGTVVPNFAVPAGKMLVVTDVLGIVRQGAVPWTAGFAAALTVGTSLTSSAPALRAYEPLTSAAVSAEMAVVREHLHSGAVFSPNLNVCVSAFLQHGSGFGVAQVTQARVTGYLIAE